MKRIFFATILLTLLLISTVAYSLTIQSLSNNGVGWHHSHPLGMQGDVVNFNFTIDGTTGDATSYSVRCKSSANTCFRIEGPVIVISPITAPEGSEDVWGTGNE
jgi:hypothetical protein